MAIKFTVENTEYNVSDNYTNEDSFIVKSSPRPYNVTIKESSLIQDEIKAILDENQKNILMVDENVYNLYFKGLEAYKSRIFLAQANENFKTLNNGIIKLIAFLEEREFTKSEKLIVVGGGVIEDIGAFVGAVYKRGINWIYYPTTLLSMCDSCIGGKTGINHNHVKNQLALFSAPREVIINTQFLKTLSDFDIKSGMGEILKLLVTGGTDFIALYENEVENGEVKEFSAYRKLILSSLSVKRAIIEEDEFEFHNRKSLNYGHTLGHAIESLSDYQIPHGQAVIIGMVIVNKLAEQKGILNKDDYKLTQRLAKELLKDSIVKKVNLKGLDTLLKKDKKTEGNMANFVVITELGCTKFVKMKIDNQLIDLISQIINEEF